MPTEINAGKNAGTEQIPAPAKAVTLQKETLTAANVTETMLTATQNGRNKLYGSDYVEIDFGYLVSCDFLRLLEKKESLDS